MVHSSTYLAFCWHFEQVLDDFSLSRQGDISRNECGESSENKSRQQKFREQGGPSRESLQRSHIVSILRQIPALPGLESRNHDDWGTEFEKESNSQEELPVDVRWPLSAVSELGEEAIVKVDWNATPASADPARGFGYKTRVSPTERRSACRAEAHGGGEFCFGVGRDEGKLCRGERKRSQVESIATALKLLNLPAGSVVVDFGSGSGALSLPLACLFEEFSFVCVDYKQESLRLLDLRAQAAKLSNVTTWQGQIEDYLEPFDACVALHACGHATDLALLQALRWRAGYVVSPCCVGKIQFAVRSPSCTGIVPDNNYNNSYTPQNLRTAVATENGYIFPNLRNSGSANAHVTNHSSTPLALKNFEVKTLEFRDADTLNRTRRVASLTSPSSSKLDVNGPCLTYPRSQWLTSVITTDDFLLLARTADWSSYEYENGTSPLHSLCKVMVELDRNQASQEQGYRSWLFSLADRKAGTVGVSHILVGKPPL